MMREYGLDFRARKVDTHAFSAIPDSDVPRSRFRMQTQHKTTFSASNLVPVYLQEVLPGDSFKVRMQAVCRLATPFFPLMDNLDLESWFFFVPNRLVWIHWPNFCGEQNSPSDTTSYQIPQVQSPAGGFAVNSLADYFGLPTAGQVAGSNIISVSCLPFRAYNLIFQEWFRDQNLQNAVHVGSGGALLSPGNKFICQSDDGPDPIGNFPMQFVCKRHDYFTACLPWTQKLGSNPPVTIPFSGNPTVKPNATALLSGVWPATQTLLVGGGTPAANVEYGTGAAGNQVSASTGATVVGGGATYFSNLYADMSTAGATMNALRLAIAQQQFYEKSARGGTRYTEIVHSFFKVKSPDARLMRPEYLGGGKTPIMMAPVPQTSATALTGSTTALGSLSGVGTFNSGDHGFSGSFVEHGYILGLVAVRRDQVYQQGMRQLWSRLNPFDFYWPPFANIGEQPVLNKEIFCDGSGNDTLVFGYQEAWASYRFHPAFTSGFFRSTSPTPLDAWHCAEKFAALPVLNSTFIQDETSTVLQRNLSAGAAANNQQFLCDLFFDQVAARPMPMYSVPGLFRL